MLRERGEPAIPFVGYPQDIVMSQYSPEGAERIIETPVESALFHVLHPWERELGFVSRICRQRQG